MLVQAASFPPQSMGPVSAGPTETVGRGSTPTLALADSQARRRRRHIVSNESKLGRPDPDDDDEEDDTWNLQFRGDAVD